MLYFLGLRLLSLLFIYLFLFINLYLFLYFLHVFLHHLVFRIAPVRFGFIGLADPVTPHFGDDDPSSPGAAVEAAAVASRHRLPLTDLCGALPALHHLQLYGDGDELNGMQLAAVYRPAMAQAQAVATAYGVHAACDQVRRGGHRFNVSPLSSV